MREETSASRTVLVEIRSAQYALYGFDVPDSEVCGISVEQIDYETDCRTMPERNIYGATDRNIVKVGWNRIRIGAIKRLGGNIKYDRCKPRQSGT